MTKTAIRRGKIKVSINCIGATRQPSRKNKNKNPHTVHEHKLQIDEKFKCKIKRNHKTLEEIPEAIKN